MPTGEITRLLVELREGREKALPELLGLVYDQLRVMAHLRLSSSGGDQTLNTTALVHEAYLKLFDRPRLTWQDRAHFFSVAAMAMRQIVVDHARRKQALKRGGGRKRVDLDSTDVPMNERHAEILSLEDALSRLGARNQRLARVVELRYFGGLSLEETAEVLAVDARTVNRDWLKARAYLYRLLADTDADADANAS